MDSLSAPGEVPERLNLKDSLSFATNVCPSLIDPSVITFCHFDGGAYMSFVSANDHPTPVSPQDPLYYAPPSVRNKAGTPKVPRQVGSNGLPIISSVADKQHEESFADFACPLEPQFHLARSRRRALITIASGMGVAVAVTAIGALVFFTVSSKSKSEPSEVTVSISTPASAAPAQESSGNSEALLRGFMNFQLGDEKAQQVISKPGGPAKEESEKAPTLLEKFIKWEQQR
jgi:hypothetical protein